MDGSRDHWAADSGALAARVFLGEEGVVGVALGRGGGEPGEHQGASGEDGAEVHLERRWKINASAKLIVLWMDSGGRCACSDGLFRGQWLGEVQRSAVKEGNMRAM